MGSVCLGWPNQGGQSAVYLRHRVYTACQSEHHRHTDARIMMERGRAGGVGLLGVPLRLRYSVAPCRIGQCVSNQSERPSRLSSLLLMMVLLMSVAVEARSQCACKLPGRKRKCDCLPRSSANPNGQPPDRPPSPT